MRESFWRELAADARRTYADSRPSLWHVTLGPLVHPGLRAAVCYRIAHRLHRFRAVRPLACILKRVGRLVSGSDLHPEARLAGGLHLPHPIGVVVGPTVETLGPATIFQDVTIGARAGEGGRGPRLGPYTFVYPGARILGGVEVGERTQVGPNCVIYHDLPPCSTVLPPEPRVLAGLTFSLRFPRETQAAAPPVEVPA